MFDFAQIGVLAERIETFTTDLDSRLEELNNRVKQQNAMLAMLVLLNDHPDSAGRITNAERLVLDEMYEAAFGVRHPKQPFMPTGLDEEAIHRFDTPEDVADFHTPLYRDDGDITANADDR